MQVGHGRDARSKHGSHAAAAPRVCMEVPSSSSLLLSVTIIKGLQGLLEHRVHNAVGAYTRPMSMSRGPPYKRCGALCSINPCSEPGALPLLLEFAWRYHSPCRARKEHRKWFYRLSPAKWLKPRLESGLDWLLCSKSLGSGYHLTAR